MGFQHGVGGINAAAKQLDVIGNNVANAGTIGFKGSRAEFADMYASNFYGVAATQTGLGVKTETIAQQFSQGGITTTGNQMDMAISGNGFFVLKDVNGTSYSRNGQFKIDREGNIVTNNGSKLQGWGVNPTTGEIESTIQDLKVDNSLLDGRATDFPGGIDASPVRIELNLDSRSTPLNTLPVPTLTANSSTPGAAPGETAVRYVQISPTQAVAVATNTTPPVSIGQKGTIDNAGVFTPDPDFYDASFSYFDGTVTRSYEPNVTGGSIAVDTSSDPSIGSLVVATNTAPLISYVELPTGEFVVVESSDPTQVGLIGNAVDDGSGNFTFTSNTPAQYYASSFLFTANAIKSRYTPTLGAGSNQAAVSFDPRNSNTYTHTTSTKIYDSLGNPYTMNVHLVKKEMATGSSVTSPWDVYVNVIDPKTNMPITTGLTNPQTVTFDTRGKIVGDSKLAFGTFTPSAEPPKVAANPIDISLDLAGTTQQGASFAVNKIIQQGYAPAVITNLEVSKEGVISARYSNGQNKEIGQVVLANFANQQGLQPIGNNRWIQTYLSGDEILNAPGSTNTGLIQAQSLEESNIDLTAELVNMITAQRYYQANAQTIKVQDAVLQSVINLR